MALKLLHEALTAKPRPMKIFNLTILAVLVLLTSNCAFTKKIDTHPLKVDSFETKNGSVEVIFYEPLNNVKQVFPKITSNNLTELEKAELWDKYLQTHALYLFKFTSKDSNEITYYCIRGSEAKKDTAYFYKVEVIKNLNKKNFDPNIDKYEKNITKVFDDVKIRGELFESMEVVQKLIKEKKVNPGDGIKFLYYIRRITPYQEIKNYTLELIKLDNNQ